MKAKDKQAIGLIVAMVVVVGVLVVLQQVLTDKRSYDEDTLCAIGETARQSVVLIDKSDKWDENDIARVDDLLNHINQEVGPQERLTIVSIAGIGREETNVSNVFDKCNPGSEKECNMLYQNCRKIRRRYSESFKSVLDSVVVELRQPGESSYSPIFETLVQVVDDSEAALVDVHLVTDLMENGRKFRFYDEIPLAEELVAEYELPGDVDVRAYAHVVERQRHSRKLIEAVDRVWQEYFEIQNVKMQRDRLIIAE